MPKKRKKEETPEILVNWGEPPTANMLAHAQITPSETSPTPTQEASGLLPPWGSGSLNWEDGPQTIVFSTRTMVPTKIVAIHPDFIPKYKTKGAACCDLVANTEGKVVTINPGMTVRIDCGFRMQLPPGFEAQIRARSSMASKGVVVTNGPGTVDEDYRGPVMVILTNVGKDIIQVNHKDRIAQLALKQVLFFSWEESEALDETERNEGGFGSTGS